MDEKIRARIAELKQGREEAVRQVFGFDAAIGELEALLQAEPAQAQITDLEAQAKVVHPAP